MIKLMSCTLDFGEQSPDGVVEIADGVQLNTTEDGELTGIEKY